MHPRIDHRKIAPEAMRVMFGLENYIHQCGLPENLLHLVKLRVSQINGCAYCIDMHSKDLRAVRETEQRLYLLDAWREAPFYSDKERAALAWAEAITLLAQNGISDDLYEATHAVFNEREIISLTMAVVAINGWNRINVAFRTEAGHYVSRRHETKEQAPTA